MAAEEKSKNAKKKNSRLGKGLQGLFTAGFENAEEIAAAKNKAEAGHKDTNAADSTKAIKTDDIIENKDYKEAIVELKIVDINPAPNQPRKHFDEEKLQELAESIKTHGIIQPIIVSESEDAKGQYTIVAGERRWRAARSAGLDVIPAIVRSLDKISHLQQALVENIQREDLNPIEESEAYKSLIEECNMTQEELASCIGKSRSSVANSLRLLNLPESVRSRISSSELSVGHAKVLLGLKDEELQEDLSQEILKKQMSVRDLEKYILRMKKAAEKLEEEAAEEDEESYNEKRLRELEYKKIEDELSSHLGNKVKVITGKGEGGFMKIAWDSPEQLEKIIFLLRGEDS